MDASEKAHPEKIPEEMLVLQQQQNYYGSPNCGVLQTILGPINSSSPSKPAFIFNKTMNTKRD